jgi:imidazolonepropionase-like amidohydrolase
MAEKGVWWSLQPFLDDGRSAFPEGSPNRLKQLEMFSGTDTADAEAAATEGAELAKLVRWYTPVEVLKIATADNAQLLALSGKRSPYIGTLGVVTEGALADLLIIDGDPLADIQLIANPAKNIVMIMKDGKIYKNTLQ